MSDSFKIGDVIELNSGSSKMTITGFLDEDSFKNVNNGIAISFLNTTKDSSLPYVVCEWFDSNNKKHKDAFSKEAIKIYDESSKY